MIKIQGDYKKTSQSLPPLPIELELLRHPKEVCGAPLHRFTICSQNICTNRRFSDGGKSCSIFMHLMLLPRRPFELRQIFFISFLPTIGKRKRKIQPIV
jgi:hypothetical protein